jgi:hypothetical protein
VRLDQQTCTPPRLPASLLIPCRYSVVGVEVDLPVGSGVATGAGVKLRRANAPLARQP